VQVILLIGEQELVLDFVCFSINDTLWATGLAWVREVVRPSMLNKLPNSPDYIAGMINVRGDVIPVFNGADLLMPGYKHDGEDGRAIMIFHFDDELFGLKVHHVKKVISVNREDISAVKHIEGAAEVFAGGVINSVDNSRVIVLNTENLLLFFRKNRRQH
jgi:purine-binding chemotaxis protein CheW